MSEQVNIGIDDQARAAIAAGLKRLLADTYTLYLKTHNYHWNVTGPRFRDLHLLWEEQYTELAVAVDDVAERIRTLGHPAPRHLPGIRRPDEHRGTGYRAGRRGHVARPRPSPGSDGAHGPRYLALSPGSRGRVEREPHRRPHGGA